MSDVGKKAFTVRKNRESVPLSKGWTAVVLCAVVVLEGCAGVSSPSGTPTETATATPTETTDRCTPVGGKRLEAVPLDDPANVTATPFESLGSAERELFLSMRNETVKVRYPVPDYPPHVEHDGTVYEVVVVSLWDGCV